MQERQGSGLEGGSKIVVYEGIATGPFDGLTLPYNKDLAGTNAFVVGGDRTVCGIFHLVPKGGDMDCLYLTRAAGLSCRESGVSIIVFTAWGGGSRSGCMSCIRERQM